MMKKKSVVSQATTIKIRKKNSVLKKSKDRRKKIPRQIFVDKIFRCLLKSTKQKYVLRPQKKF